MSNLSNLIDKFNPGDYSSEELEDFGRKISADIVLNIGFIQYANKGMYNYDFKQGELGKLADMTAEIILGFLSGNTRLQYEDKLVKLLRYIDSLEAVVAKSTKENLKVSITNELKSFESLGSYKDYDNWLSI